MARIISIVRKKIETQRLYNLAVQDDESYIANGIIVHNCKSRYTPNLKANKGNPEIDRGVTVSKKGMDAMTLAEHTCSHGYRIT